MPVLSEISKNLAKVHLTHVPYRGAGPATTDLLNSQVDVIFATAAAVTPFLQNGKLRAIGMTTAQRSPLHPNVPTIAESGVPSYAVESWYGLYVPEGTPSDVIGKLNATAKKAIESDAFRKRAHDEGLIISAGDSAELSTYVRAVETRWTKIGKENNITPK
jgi:tripartite-type tricarboxylate transporter receptor subunit TctC